MLSERTQTKRVHIVLFYLYKTLENANYSVVTESRSMVAWRGGRGK